MSGTVPIISGPITGMMKVKDRPVFFLKTNNSPTWNIVVKGDARKEHAREQTRTSIVWSSKLMKGINNRLVNTKLMTHGEIANFASSAKSFFTDTKSEAYRQSVEAIQVGNVFEWVKMPFVQGLSDADFFDDKNKKFEVAEQVIQKFTNEDVWRELGVVVAADIFNGNNDRFNISTGAWQNRGNIMFLTGGSTSVIGLDTYDPNSLISDLESTVIYKELDILRHSGLQLEFALKCTTGVGAHFKQMLYTVGDKSQKGRTLAIPNGEAYLIAEENNLKEFFTGFAPVFAEGLQRGAIKLKTYLQRKYSQYYAPARPKFGPVAPPRPTTAAGVRAQPPMRGAMPQMIWQERKAMPSGVVARMKYLGW